MNAAAAPVHRHQICVCAASIAEAVEGIGGWLYDQVVSGWEVVLLVETPEVDRRAAAILGVGVTDLHDAMQQQDSLLRPGVLAVSVGVLDSPGVDDGVRRALRGGSAGVLMWGERHASNAAYTSEPYECSAAAVAFKRHAVAALRAPKRTQADSTEELLVLRPTVIGTANRLA